MLKRNRKIKETDKGARNLVILGILSTIIALSTTGVSLAIYHNSGDIYLDRSRPGYLPDEEEIESEDDDEEEEEYVFEKNGKLTKKDLELFLSELNEEIEEIDEYKEPFSDGVVSDERLGIPAAEEKPVEGEG